MLLSFASVSRASDSPRIAIEHALSLAEGTITNKSKLLVMVYLRVALKTLHALLVETLSSCM